MTVKQILRAKDPLLHQETTWVPEEAIRSSEIQKIIQDLLDTLGWTPQWGQHITSVGIAANQIGYSWRIAVI